MTPAIMAALAEEAVETIWRLEWCEGSELPRRLRAAFHPVVHDHRETYGWQPVTVRPGPPSPDAIDRLDRFLALLAETLDDEERKLIWARAYHCRWPSIARKIRSNRYKARRAWKTAILKLTVQANGPMTAASIAGNSPVIVA